MIARSFGAARKEEPVSQNRRTGAVALAAIAVLGLAGPSIAQAQASSDGLSPFAGTWKINLARSRMGRAGPNGTPQPRAESFTWVYAPKGRGLAWQIYHTWPLPKPDKVMTVIPDGKYRTCEMKETCLSRPGDPKEQSYAFWRMNDHMFARIFRVKGVPVEHNVYAVSPDGKTFVTTVWDPATPEYQSTMVFEKQP